MAAGGERNIESNQFAIDVSLHFISEGQKLIVCYKQFRNEVSTCQRIYRYIIFDSYTIWYVWLECDIYVKNIYACLEYDKYV